MADFIIVSNHQQVIKSIEDLQAKVGNPLAVTIHRWTAERVAETARGLAHIGPDPTYPRGRPHTYETVRKQPLNQYATRVLANYGAPWEEKRGGDHAFMSKAVEIIEPEALVHFEQLGLDVIASIQ